MVDYSKDSNCKDCANYPCMIYNAIEEGKCLFYKDKKPREDDEQ